MTDEMIEKDKLVSLERSLRPLWKITFYGGFLFDWCRKIPSQCCASFWVRFVGCFIWFALLVLNCVFELVQLGLVVMQPYSSIHSIVNNLIWLCQFPAALASMAVFLQKRRLLLSFFEDWRHLESQLPLLALKKKDGRLYTLLYGGYLVMAVVMIAGVTVVMVNRTEASYLLSHYPTLRDAMTLPGVFIFHLSSVTVGLIFVSLADLVPAWTFFHAGIALRALAAEIEYKNGGVFKVDNNLVSVRDGGMRFQSIWTRFEVLSKLIKRANKLFGSLVIIEQFLLLFMICVLVYMVLSEIRDPNWDTIVCLVGTIVFSLRLSTTLLMASKLHASSQHLKLVLSKSLLISGSQNQVAQFEYFYVRVKESSLTARPWDLYDVTPSALLKVFGLVISYVIVLLQSRSK